MPKTTARARNVMAREYVGSSFDPVSCGNAMTAATVTKNGQVK
jgi:hypothetical protein